MAWWKTLIISLTILVLCKGEESSCRIWSEHGNWVINGEYVFCHCNGSSTTSSDIKFEIQEPFVTSPIGNVTSAVYTEFLTKEKSILSPLEIVDNFTVRRRVLFFWTLQKLFYCGTNKGHEMSVAAEKIFKILPTLYVSNIECRSYQKEDVGNCTFQVFNFPYLQETKYFMSANGSPKIKCVAFPNNNIECQNVPINQNITTNHFKIERKIMGIIQSQEKTLNRNAIVIPNWKFMKVKYEFETEENLNCRCVRVLSKYEGLDCKVKCNRYIDWNLSWPFDYKRISIEQNNYTCFSDDVSGYKKIKCQIVCRFGGDESPWSEEYIFNCTTVATLPSNPPQILPNGFFYDPDEKQLYIFWFDLYDEYRNGPNFGYAARSSDGKNATIVANTMALFHGWEPSLPATIHVWSVNSVGHSKGSSSLKLDSLTNVNQQCRNLYYNDEDQVLRWDPPTDTNNLVGYTAYWCTASLNIHQICDTEDELRMEDLSLSQHQYRFPKSMNFSNMAVAVRYSDKIGGGMRWTGYKWIRNKTPSVEPPGAGISYYLAPIGVSILIALCIYVYRICRKCNDIEVVLCEGLLLDRNKSPPTPEAPVVFSGCVSPEAVMDINRLVPPKTAEMENESQEEDSEPSPDTQEALADAGSYSFVKVSDF